MTVPIVIISRASTFEQRAQRSSCFIASILHQIHPILDKADI